MLWLTLGRHSVREICQIVGISRNTFYKYTRGADPPQPGQEAARLGSAPVEHADRRREEPAP